MCGRFTQNYSWEEVYAFLKVFGTPRNLRPQRRGRARAKWPLVTQKLGLALPMALTLCNQSEPGAV